MSERWIRDLLKATNAVIASKVEHPFQLFLQQFGIHKTRPLSVRRKHYNINAQRNNDKPDETSY
jgi:hypothetical protein